MADRLSEEQLRAIRQSVELDDAEDLERAVGRRGIAALLAQVEALTRKNETLRNALETSDRDRLASVQQRENVLSPPMAAGLLLTLKAECEAQHARAEAAEQQVAALTSERDEAVRVRCDGCDESERHLMAEVKAERAAKEAAIEELESNRRCNLFTWKELYLSANAKVTALQEQLDANPADARLRAFVKQVAAGELCEDGKSECESSSGPYCQRHAFDEGDILAARELMASMGATPSNESERVSPPAQEPT